MRDDERKPLVPHRLVPRTEHKEAESAELCIRVMERFLDAVEDDPNIDDDTHTNLWSLYADVLQEELGPYAFQLAFEAYSKFPGFEEARAERAKRDAGEASPPDDDEE
jgi:hypothetical protein